MLVGVSCFAGVAWLTDGPLRVGVAGVAALLAVDDGLAAAAVVVADAEVVAGAGLGLARLNEPSALDASSSIDASSSSSSTLMPLDTLG